MIFVGIVSNNKKFENIKKIIYKNMNKNEINLININSNSIDNLKNIKFEIIVLLELSKQIEDENEKINSLCKQTKYLLVDSDKKFKENIFKEIKSNIITFGGNHYSTVTFSSVTDESILISVQRNFTNLNGNITEVGEYYISIEKYNRTSIYEILIDFIISKIYN